MSFQGEGQQHGAARAMTGQANRMYAVRDILSARKIGIECLHESFSSLSDIFVFRMTFLINTTILRTYQEIFCFFSLFLRIRDGGRVHIPDSVQRAIC